MRWNAIRNSAGCSSAHRRKLSTMELTKSAAGIIRSRISVDPGTQHLEGAVAQRDEQALLGLEQAVDRARRRSRLVGNPPHRERVGAVCGHNPLRRVQQCLSGLFVVNSGTTHIDKHSGTSLRYNVPKRRCETP